MCLSIQVFQQKVTALINYNILWLNKVDWFSDQQQPSSSMPSENHLLLQNNNNNNTMLMDINSASGSRHYQINNKQPHLQVIFSLKFTVKSAQSGTSVFTSKKSPYWRTILYCKTHQ